MIDDKRLAEIARHLKDAEFGYGVMDNRVYFKDVKALLDERKDREKLVEELGERAARMTEEHEELRRELESHRQLAKEVIAEEQS